VQDALSGVAYKDDGQIVGIYARRFEDKHNPRAEVTVMLASQCRGIERD
jgi:Holliday junction resolvase RusA-like endonuclease